MNNYLNIIKADYLQRFRSYTFMITLLGSVVLAYSFVPTADANYTTVTIGNFVGLNNAAWVGHTTAIMASAFLWLFGFYIINNGIKRDKETGVGQIIATTSINNYQYLLAKSLSNFLILLSLLGIIILVALTIVIYRGGAYEFSVVQFITPYLFTTVPSLFYLAVLTIVLEIIFRNKTILLNIAFFFLFIFIIATTDNPELPSVSWLDPLGVKFLTNEIVLFVNTISTESYSSVSVGFNKSLKELEFFLFTGSNLSGIYILSRFVWALVAFILLKVASVFFNRFDDKGITPNKRKKALVTSDIKQANIKEFKASTLVKTESNFGIFPLFKTEFLLLIRKGEKWFWLINLAGIIVLFYIPLDIGVKIGLPIFWFLQVNRWADLSTKEIYFGTDKFIYSTHKPLQRMLTAQILAGISLAVLLAMPVIIRLVANVEIVVASEVIIGAIILVAFAVCSGIVFGSKRFFEVVLFFTTYMATQSLSFKAYWVSAFPNINYIIIQIVISIMLIVIAYISRNYVIKKQ